MIALSHTVRKVLWSLAAQRAGEGAHLQGDIGPARMRLIKMGHSSQLIKLAGEEAHLQGSRWALVQGQMWCGSAGGTWAVLVWSWVGKIHSYGWMSTVEPQVSALPDSESVTRESAPPE